MAPLKLEEEGIRQEAAPGPAGLGGGALSNSVAAATGRDDAGVAAAGAAAPQEPQLAYVLACPACRAEVAPDSLAFAWARLQVGMACGRWAVGGRGAAAARGLGRWAVRSGLCWRVGTNVARMVHCWQALSLARRLPAGTLPISLGA